MDKVYDYEQQQHNVRSAALYLRQAIGRIDTCRENDIDAGGDGKEYVELLEGLKAQQLVLFAFVDALQPLVEGQQQARNEKRSK